MRPAVHAAGRLCKVRIQVGMAGGLQAIFWTQMKQHRLQLQHCMCSAGCPAGKRQLLSWPSSHAALQEHMFPADNTTGKSARTDATGQEAENGESTAEQAGSAPAEGQGSKAGKAGGDGSKTEDGGVDSEREEAAQGGSRPREGSSDASNNEPAGKSGGTAGDSARPGVQNGTGGTEEHTGEGGKGRHGERGSGGGTIALVCGPPPMVDRACVPALQELGFDEEHIVVF